MTLAEALNFGANIIGQRDAALFLSHIKGESCGHIKLHGDEPLAPACEKTYQDYLARRQRGEPLQYIIGSWDFMGNTLGTDSRALIPRPETELLVEAAFNFINKKSVRVMDLCTGSGCIAIALASMAKDAGVDMHVVAVDVSPSALALARENAGDCTNIRFVQSNLFDDLENEKFDIIISNPPYIPSGEMSELEPVVRDYEPHLALDGGVDGMDFYRRIVPRSLDFLCPGGALFLEIGPVAVKDILTESGFEDIHLSNDYAGLPRILRGIAPFA